MEAFAIQGKSITMHLSRSATFEKDIFCPCSLHPNDLLCLETTTGVFVVTPQGLKTNFRNFGLMMRGGENLQLPITAKG